MKKRIALLLCLMLVFTMTPSMVFADDDVGGVAKKLYYCDNLPEGVTIGEATDSELPILKNGSQLTEDDLIASGSGWNSGQIDGTVGGSKTIYIAYVKDGKAYTSSKEGFFESQNTTAVTLSNVEGEKFYKLTFNSSGGAEIRVTNDSSFGSFFVDVQGNQGGEGEGGNSSTPSGIVFLDGEYNRIIDSNIIYDELGEGDNAGKFYIVFSEEGSFSTTDISIIDHYNTMNQASDGSGGKPDVVLTSDVIGYEAVNSTDSKDVFEKAAKAAGFDDPDGSLHVFAASVNSDELKEFSYRESGIVCGSLKIARGDNDPLESEIAVCSSGFVSDFTVNDNITDENDTLKFVESQDNTSAIDEKTVKMFEILDSEANKIYLSVKGNAEPRLLVYARYEGAYGNSFYEKVESCASLSDTASNGVYTITLNKFYGHNDLVLIAEVGEAKKVLTVHKAIRYEFDDDAFAVSDDIYDYMNELWGSDDDKRLEEDTTSSDVITKTNNNIGRNRSGNMPYNGGHYGTVIRLANNHRLVGIEATRSGESVSSEVTIHLDYLINQNIYYEVSYTGSGTPSKDVFNANYENFQISFRDDDSGKYLVEVDIGLAEFNWNVESEKYVMNPYNAVLDAVTGYYNLVDWMENAFDRQCKIELKGSCLYYDIYCGGNAGSDDESIQTLYNELDKIGTIKFVTADDDINFDGDVGVKAADDVSKDCWNNEDEFSDFDSDKKDSDDIESHENAIASFNGSDDESVVSAYDFSMGEDNEDDFDGMLDVYMPIPKSVEKNPEDCKVYWMAQDGDNDPYPIPMPARYVEGTDGKAYMAFTTSHFSDYVLVADAANVKEDDENTGGSTEGNTGGNTSGSTGGSIGGGGAVAAPEVTTDTAASTTTSKTDVKLTESSNADGTSSSTANVSVSAANQKEILKQAAAKKSENIVLNVSAADTKDADTVEVTLDKSFIESIINDTNATLTVKTPLGDKTYTQDELKALAAAADGKTVTITIAKSDEKSDEEMQQQAQQGVAKASMKARSSKTAKGNIKVFFRPDDETESFISEMKALGYTVKYRFYRSTKKSSGYKAMLTKSGKTYINTSGKAGTRYYYKVQVRVYDENGKLVAKTALKQCKYATRIFG